MTDEWLKQALELPGRERADLAYHLLLSLEPDRDPDAEAAWAAELDARLDRVERGEFTASDWREALERIRQSLPRGDTP